MKDTKTEFRFFSVPAWKKEEAYLREQHKKGWEFVFLNGPGFYHFRRCEPEDVIYQLDYNPDSVTQKKEYLQIFQDCGWEYLQNYVGYSYFRKKASEFDGKEEEIFCDDDSRLDMMKRVFVGRMVPLLIIFFLVIIPQMVIQSLDHTPVVIMFGILLLVYLGIFFSFAVQFWKYYRSVCKK